MLFTVEGIVILLNEVQFAKAELPIVVKPSGNTISLIPEHPEKAELPIVVNELGKVTFVILLMLLNALPEIEVVPSAITNSVK